MQLWFRAAFAAVLCFASFSGASAQGVSPDEIWREVREADVARTPRARQIVPQRYRSFALNRGRLTALLATAPHERARSAAQSSLALSLPLPDGGYGLFTVIESPVMEAELAAKYPALKTYLGQGIDDPTATVRFDITPKGFHAQVIAAGGTVFIDPFQPDDLDHYIAYRKDDHAYGQRGICHVTGEPMSKAHARSHAKVASGATLRTYRLAMAATGEYTAFHGGTVIDALSAIVTTMNRVNGIYEREASVRMVLVANNDEIIYTNAATDPYANTSGDLNANQSNIDAEIGSANYDIGHLVGTGGGGIAQIRSPCGPSKARGLTGSPAPVGDAFDIDYVAHEMGHQFGGNHTFNGSGGSCSGNRNATTAAEPGSGITIQGYAGICGGDDLQPNSEDYFHRVSLDEILAFTTNAGTGASCGTATSTGNAVPTVSTASGFSIPGRTPFTLTASGADANGDTLTYVWEQVDVGTENDEGVLDPTVLTGPMFRSFTPSTDPSRTFPSWRWILANANVPPATAPLPGTTTPEWMTGEVLPNVARTLGFRVTARDNRAGGGGTIDASTTVTVVNTAGPFAVTAPNTAVSLAAGASTTVTWNVALSNLVPISTANVRITLSIDGGNTFPLELLASTPNDGSESVTLPAGVASTQARIRVQAVGNIFFDVSDTDFTLTSGGNTPPSISVTASLATRQGSPLASGVVATVSDAQQAASSLGVSVSGAPPELATSVQNVAGNVTLSATAQCSLVAPTTGSKVYPLTLTATDGAGGASSATVNVNVSANRAPTLGAYAVLNMTRTTSRQLAPAPAAADADNNLSMVTVSPTTLPGGGTVAVAADGTLSVTTTAGTTLGTHTLTTQVQDACGAVESRTVTLNVAAPQVVIALAGSQVITGNALIEPNECNQVNVTLRNDGNTLATGVSATLSTGTANTSITQATAAFPDIPPGESRTSLTPFEVSTAAAATCFSTINGSLSVTFGGASGSPATTPLTLPVGRSAATNYVFTASSGATLPSDGVLLSGSQLDDGLASLVVPAGFNFSLYGTTYTGGTTLRASINGNLQFRNSQGADDFANTALPAAGVGNGQAVFPASAPTLFLQWDDWRTDGAAGGAALDAGIYTKLEGVAPNRRWIIEWRGRIRGDGAVTTNNNRAAIVLNENGGSNANSFEYIYLLTGTGAAADAAGSTIGIQAAASGAVFTQFALDNAGLAPGTRLTATLAPALCTSGSGVCGGATPGVTVTQSAGSTMVAEGGATDSYTIVLNSAPSASVTVAIAPDAQLSTSPTPSLTFTTANWNVPQTVTVTAANDVVAEGTHAGTITHTASGGGYTGVSIANVVASIADNDTAGVSVAQSGGTTVLAEGGVTDSYTLVLTSQPTAGVTITLSPDAQVATPASVSFTSADWNVPKTVTVTAVNDAVAEGGHAGTITHAATGGGYTGVAVANVVASITDNDSAGVTVAQSGGSTSVEEGGATDSYSLVLTSQPTANVTIGLTPDAQVATVASVTFTSANWNVPQNVTVTAVDDAVAEGMHSGTIQHAASGGGYGGVAIGNVVASIADNDPTPVDLAVGAIGAGTPVAGQRFTYEVVVDNLTATAVPSAAFAFTPPAALSNVTWTCAPGAGSSCPASGTNAPAHAVGLAANGTLVYTIGGDVPAGTPAGTVLTGNATIGVAAPFQDTAPANNADSSVDTVQGPAVFRNGFEEP